MVHLREVYRLFYVNDESKSMAVSGNLLYVVQRAFQLASSLEIRRRTQGFEALIASSPSKHPYAFVTPIGQLIREFCGCSYRRIAVHADLIIEKSMFHELIVHEADMNLF
jgi:hypothetical protein